MYWFCPILVESVMYTDKYFLCENIRAKCGESAWNVYPSSEGNVGGTKQCGKGVPPYDDKV